MNTDILDSKLNKILKSDESKKYKCFMASLLYLEASSKCVETSTKFNNKELVLNQRDLNIKLETCKHNLLKNFSEFIKICW